ncbi:MAG TPA: chemotaxis protein CheB, partial [Actinomycetota bacterium]|nr:chemotaxis protein CheB [Actinomycetota bacterium]
MNGAGAPPGRSGGPATAGIAPGNGRATERTPIRAVVIEDSPAQRTHLVRILQADGDIEVVGLATTAREAVDLVARIRPDVVALGLQPRDPRGKTTIEQIMARAPTAILALCPALDGPHSEPAVDALSAGALDVLPKPPSWAAGDEAQLRRCLRSLHKVGVVRPPRARTAGRGSWVAPAPVTASVVALAASTGGPPALAEVLSGLGGLDAPVLVVQHIHPDFVPGLVTWMSRACPLPVELARHGATALPGRVYVAGGGRHLRLDARRRLALSTLPVTIHRPSADELLRSVAEHAGAAGIGVVLTGMGDDGARGLLALRQRGGRTLAQDEATSAVFGMPSASRRLGAV